MKEAALKQAARRRPLLNLARSPRTGACATLIASLALAGCSASANQPTLDSQGNPSLGGGEDTAPSAGGETPQEPGSINPGPGGHPSAAPPNPGSPPAGTSPDDGVYIEDVAGNDITSSNEVKGDGQLVDGKVCNEKDIAFEKVIPTVLIMVDRSTSMFAADLPNGRSPTFGDYPDRWEALRDALTALEPLSDEVAFGIATYTGLPDQCPLLEHLDEVPPALGGFERITGALLPSAEAIPEAKSETPTKEAILAGIDALSGVEIEGPKYLLLVTDGEPDTCNVPDPQCGQDAAIGAAQLAYEAGVTTYVIGLPDEDLGGKFLNDLAHAGQGLEVQPPASDELWCIQQELQLETFDFSDWRSSAEGSYGADTLTYTEDLYFQPEDVEALRTQLTQLIAGVRSCAFEMDTAVNRSQADRGAVQLQMADGATVNLTHGDANGWELSADNDYTVELNGTACEQIQTEQASGVLIEFPCEVRVPLVK